jgi:hypothetical protein
METNHKSSFSIRVFDAKPQIANYIAGLLHLYGFFCALPVSKLLEVREHLLQFNFGLILMGIGDDKDFERRFRGLLPDRKAVFMDLRKIGDEVHFDRSDFDYFALLFKAEELLSLVRAARFEQAK